MVIEDNVGKGGVKCGSQSIDRIDMEGLPEKEKYEQMPEGNERLSCKIPEEEHYRKCSMVWSKTCDREHSRHQCRKPTVGSFPGAHNPELILTP